MVEFGNTLKTLRLQNNFTQAQLAQRLGVTKSVISAYETGLRMPSYDVLISISQIFKVTTDYLLGLEKKAGTRSVWFDRRRGPGSDRINKSNET